MFNFFKTLVSGPKHTVVQSLRISINKLDIHLAVRQMDPNVAFARAAIYSGASLTRDFTVSMRNLPELRKLLSGDINTVIEPVTSAHRAAVIGLAAIVLGDNLRLSGTAIDLIFEAEPRSGADDDVVVAICKEREAAARAQHAALAMEVAARLGVTPTENTLADLIAVSAQRLEDFKMLSKSTANRPYLDYLQKEIL